MVSIITVILTCFIVIYVINDILKRHQMKKLVRKNLEAMSINKLRYLAIKSKCRIGLFFKDIKENNFNSYIFELGETKLINFLIEHLGYDFWEIVFKDEIIYSNYFHEKWKEELEDFFREYMETLVKEYEDDLEHLERSYLVDP